MYRKLPGNAVEHVNLLINIADTHLENGELNKAEIGLAEVEKRLNRLVKLKLLDRNHPIFARFNNYYGGLYARRQNYPKAASRFRQAKDLLERNKMTEHHFYATLLNNIATLYVHEGDAYKARDSFPKVISILSKTLGANHPEVGRTYVSLSWVHFITGDPVSAEEDIRKAIEILENRPGFELFLAAAYNNRGGMSKQKGLTKEAESDFRRSFELRKKFKKQKPLEYSESLVNLADIFIDTRRADQAEAMCKEAADIRGSIVGLEPDAYAIILLSYGRALAVNGKPERAVEVWKQAVTLADKSPEREILAQSLNNLGEIYRRLKRFNDAEPLLKRSYEMWPRIRMGNSLAMLNTCNHYRDLFLDQGMPVPQGVLACIQRFNK